jgi:membrane protein implicated in regulation of membrane protease activity
MDHQGLIWLALALVAAVVEILSLSLVFLMVAGGAAAAALVAALGGSPPLAVLTFAATTGLLFVGVRPLLMKYSPQGGPGTVTGAAALVDREAIVLQEVTSSEGLVKLAGEIWTARAAPSAGRLEVGSRVRVVAIAGATAVVTPLPPRAVLPGGAYPSDGPEPVE